MFYFAFFSDNFCRADGGGSLLARSSPTARPERDGGDGAGAEVEGQGGGLQGGGGQEEGGEEEAGRDRAESTHPVPALQRIPYRSGHCRGVSSFL